MRDFAAAIAPLRDSEFPPIEDVVACVRTEADREALEATEAGA